MLFTPPDPEISEIMDGYDLDESDAEEVVAVMEELEVDEDDAVEIWEEGL